MKPLFLTLFVILPLLLCSQTRFKGAISSNTRWSGQIYVDGDVVVSSQATLSLAPGTQLLIRAGSDAGNLGKDRDRIELIIEGQLIAEGGAGRRRIIITSDADQQRAGDWYGIILKNRRRSSLIQHCLIEYAYKSVTCYGSSPLIKQSELRNNRYAAISAEVRSKVQISNCVISGNEFAGLLCELGSNPVVDGTEFTRNQNGIISFDRSAPDLGHRRPLEGQSAGENRFQGNEVDIYHHASVTIYAQNNSWENDSGDPDERILDSSDDPRLGEVIATPVFRERRPAPIQPVLLASAAASDAPDREAQALADSAATPLEALATAMADSIPVEQPDSIPAIPQTVLPRSNNLPFSTTPNRTDSSFADSAAQFQSRRVDNFTISKAALASASEAAAAADSLSSSAPELPVGAAEILAGDAPILEVHLDGGSRRYLQLAKPVYPEIYWRTRHEGRVLTEVIVGRDGSVESFEIVKSDGPHFNTAVSAAMRKMKYRPGSFLGQPIRYKIIESFVFRMPSE